MKEKVNVRIVQSSIPKYRVPFFDSIVLNDCNFTIYASSENEKGLRSERLVRNEFDYSLGFFNCFGVIFFQTFFKYLKGMKSGDILVLSGNPRLISNFFVLFIAKFLNVKVICWSHGWSAGKHGATAKLRHLIMKLYDGVLLYTEKEVENFLKAKILTMERLYYLNNGIDFDKEIHRLGSQRCFNPKNDSKNLLFIGRLTEKSNILLILESMKFLDQSYSLKIIGDGAFSGVAKKFVKENNILNVEFVGAIYKSSELKHYFDSSDLFVYPGNVGLSLLHSFAFGVPAVLHSNSMNHQPEFAASSKSNTIYFEQGDPLSLKNAIEYYFELSRQDKISMCKSSHNIVKDKYNTKRMAENFENMIYNILDK